MAMVLVFSSIFFIRWLESPSWDILFSLDKGRDYYLPTKPISSAFETDDSSEGDL